MVPKSTMTYRLAVAVALVGLWAAGTARPAQAAGFSLIWNEWGPLAGYGVNAECNPGGGNFPCGPSDVAIAPGSDGTSSYSNVTANPRGVVTYVNAIGNIKFQ